MSLTAVKLITSVIIHLILRIHLTLSYNDEAYVAKTKQIITLLLLKYYTHYLCIIVQIKEKIKVVNILISKYKICIIS